MPLKNHFVSVFFFFVHKIKVIQVWSNMVSNFSNFWVNYLFNSPSKLNWIWLENLNCPLIGECGFLLHSYNAIQRSTYCYYRRRHTIWTGKLNSTHLYKVRNEQKNSLQHQPLFPEKHMSLDTGNSCTAQRAVLPPRTTCWGKVYLYNV